MVVSVVEWLQIHQPKGVQAVTKFYVISLHENKATCFGHHQARLEYERKTVM
jgi:hypothetical protein